MDIIDIYRLVKEFRGQKFKLDIPELHIEKGSIVGLVGNNGAGKTTFLRLLLDLLSPNSGEIRICGSKTTISDEWRKWTAGFLDESFLLDYLTVLEFLSFKAKVYGLGSKAVDLKLGEWKRLLTNDGNMFNKLIHDLSTGNKQKVGIVSAVMLSPKLLILDEPFNYLDPSSQIEVMKLLKEYKENTGATVLISSHNLEYISDVSSRVILLEDGAIIGDYDTSQVNVSSLLHEYFYSCTNK